MLQNPFSRFFPSTMTSASQTQVLEKGELTLYASSAACFKTLLRSKVFASPVTEGLLVSPMIPSQSWSSKSGLIEKRSRRQPNGHCTIYYLLVLDVQTDLFSHDDNCGVSTNHPGQSDLRISCNCRSTAWMVPVLEMSVLTSLLKPSYMRTASED